MLASGVSLTRRTVVHTAFSQGDSPLQRGQIDVGHVGAFLHMQYVGGQTLAADVGQLLQVVLTGRECTEPFDSLAVPLFGAKAALPIAPGQQRKKRVRKVFRA